ncbi:ATP-binding protein [Streptomyces sp. P9(2023)]|uniref:ATP-binding protein n=1 Tax=Streptomyces sp. P9(2023) TaxID=3064394 RepID=UPI0028F40950|nr:ATP-binding protein [Streptomyces sp. P9(2023)]MDT9689866.1 ATP-binding protein [Streptomyces sp. P9(2023)]
MNVDVDVERDGDPAGLTHLWERLARVELRVREAVAARHATDPAPDDPYRGQYLTPEGAERILAAPAAYHPGTGGPAGGLTDGAEAAPGSRLHRLAEAFGLLPPDEELLLVALAPDIDARFEPLYGYLNDDLTRRRPTIGLALDLCGLPAAGPGRFRFAGTAPLVRGGLLEIVEPDRPFLSRTLRVPDRVAAHLLGDDEPDARLAGLVDTGSGGPGPYEDTVLRVAEAAATGSGPVHVRARGGDAGRVAVDALTAAGRRPLVLDVAALATDPEVARVPHLLATEARLSGGGIVVGPIEALEPERPERARWLRELCGTAAGVPLITYGTKNWDPLWSRQSPVPFTVGPPTGSRTVAQWRQALTEATEAVRAPVAVPGDDELGPAVVSYRLDAEQVRKAATVAVRAAAAARRPLGPQDLRAAVRGQNGAGLERLARRIEPAVGWDDLVLPPPTRAQLGELALRARHRDQVLGRWRMRPGGGRGRGVIALFAGESGTGKTMSAEVVAAELGMELYVVDLSTVVDKYIGETEKNLERIFVEASEVNGVLLFDEADAIFGKRSEVKDAHDRNANIESAYLLQRMESFDGIAVLTTNLRANLDEAFTRRIDVIADFPIPDARQRLALWDRCLGPEMPRDDDLDLAFCADRFELAGGSIRACAVTAAYLAAEAGGPLGMAQVVSAVLQEYRKLGRLVLESEFGHWARRVQAPAAG